jgi:hypothetical protein
MCRKDAAVKIWFDTEFIEDGKTIDLISIGAVREDGETFYAEIAECELDRASDWVKENVFPYLTGFKIPRKEVAELFREWAGESPEFWGYYADYDWVVLCQLYGTMMDLPRGWPYFCLDVKQVANSYGNPRLPDQKTAEHNALNDALWTKEAWEFLHPSLPQTGTDNP